MSRKDFVAVAAAINALYTSTDIRNLPNQSEADQQITTAKLFGIRYTAEAMADTFSAANPRFDRQRFLSACGII